MMDYSETNEVYDIKFGIYRTLNENMQLYINQKSRSFFDPCRRLLRMNQDLR